MLFVSLLLAGPALVISGVALAIAIFRDRRDRDRRVRPRPFPPAATQSDARLTLRLWSPPVGETGGRDAEDVGFRQSCGPDMMIGGPRTFSVMTTTDGAPRKAA